MTKEGYYDNDVIEENLKYYLYHKYKMCPKNCNIIDSFKVKSPFALGSIKIPKKTGKQDPDEAYITKNNFGICGECIGKSEYKSPIGKKSYSLAHQSIEKYYNGKKINIYLAQKVLVQLFRTFLELQIKGASQVKAYFSGENTKPKGHSNTLNDSEIYPTLHSLNEENHISSFEKVTDNINCKQGIFIYDVQFPEVEQIKQILKFLNGGTEIDIDQI